ncbi:unnamed protein product [Adineta steineri]|uniref:Uncharacterized protein n=1 Tax=Adineta steineri TaxID=433720 RepID=A0A820BI27_9BILA|nr:unnamed protein product [Adineta steineri]CAF4206585.1 unnamed protein product [Adineta steineri]
MLLKTHKTFRFGTGFVLTLTENQINKIPYLAALVSTADFFEAARDDQGHFIIHPNIDIKQFRFILDWFPCGFIQDIFIRLPDDYDIVSTILHMDYLGLLNHSDPSLDEVDSSFFDVITYNPLENLYAKNIRPLQMCDMAVRFAIALIREAYDVTDDKVHDRIYYYVMFIISAHTLFDPNIRHHVYNVAEHYFSLFNPCLIKRLNRLRRIQDKYAQISRLKTTDQLKEAKHTEEKNLTPLIDTHIDAYGKLSFKSITKLNIRPDFYNYSDNERKDLFDSEQRPIIEKPLQPLYKALIETIHDRLQNQICHCLHYDLREAPFSSQSFDKPSDDSLRFSIWSCYFNSFITPEIRRSLKTRNTMLDHGRHISFETYT